VKVLLDTNIIVRAAQPNSPDWSSIEQALSKLIGSGGKLCLVPQNLYEFWVIATRPTNVILGKTAHDGRLVAAMQRHSIPNILTFNKGDFLRFPISIFTPADIISDVIPQS